MQMIAHGVMVVPDKNKIQPILGVIAELDEAKIIREKYKNNFIICTPGIRNKTKKIRNDDQKRINTVKNAIENGADYIIVGRPITQAKNPLKIVLDMKRQIECR